MKENNVLNNYVKNSKKLRQKLDKIASIRVRND